MSKYLLIGVVFLLAFCLIFQLNDFNAMTNKLSIFSHRIISFKDKVVDVFIGVLDYFKDNSSDDDFLLDNDLLDSSGNVVNDISKATHVLYFTKNDVDYHIYCIYNSYISSTDIFVILVSDHPDYVPSLRLYVKYNIFGNVSSIGIEIEQEDGTVRRDVLSNYTFKEYSHLSGNGGR